MATADPDSLVPLIRAFLASQDVDSVTTHQIRTRLRADLGDILPLNETVVNNVIYAVFADFLREKRDESAGQGGVDPPRGNEENLVSTQEHAESIQGTTSEDTSHLPAAGAIVTLTAPESTQTQDPFGFETDTDEASTTYKSHAANLQKPRSRLVRAGTALLMVLGVIFGVLILGFALGILRPHDSESTIVVVDFDEWLRNMVASLPEEEEGGGNWSRRLLESINVSVTAIMGGPGRTDAGMPVEFWTDMALAVNTTILNIRGLVSSSSSVDAENEPRTLASFLQRVLSPSGNGTGVGGDQVSWTLREWVASFNVTNSNGTSCAPGQEQCVNSTVPTFLDLVNKITDLPNQLFGSTQSGSGSSGTTPAAYAPFQPATSLLQNGVPLTRKHPIVIIPGIASTNLEAWPQATNASKSCGSQHYRKRLWGSLEQFGIMLTSKDCWMQAMMLDPETGLDSPNASIKLRAVEGVTGADYMFTGYWVFAKMIENLAYIGYDTTNMAVAGYDWRLSPTLLEERDGYMTALKNRIERMVKVTGELAVVVPHSMGNLVFFYFLNWIESVEPGWAGKNLKSWFGIAGPLLGAPQSLAGAVLTGDMGNTASLSPMTYKAVEQVISRKDRLALYRTWGGVATLFPRGGDVVWGGDMAGEFGADKSRDDGDRAWAIPAPDEVHRSIESFCLKLVDALPLDESADEFLSTGCKVYRQLLSKLTPPSPTSSTVALASPSDVSGSNSTSGVMRQLHTSFSHLISIRVATTASTSPSNTRFPGSWLFESVLPTIPPTCDLQSAFVDVCDPSELEARFDPDIPTCRCANAMKTLFPNCFREAPTSPCPRSMRSLCACAFSRYIDTPSTTPYSGAINLTVSAAHALYSYLNSHLRDKQHYHLAQSKSDLESARHDPRAWTNVLLTPLPSTLPRDFQIYCAYGLAQPTERKFFVVAQQQQQQQQGEKAEWDYRIDAELVDADEGTRNGMQHTDGDLTVPIMSSGFMCARGWRMRRYNPAGVGVVTREIEDRRSSGDRGGPGAADHTDVLGNYALVEDVLRVVSGVGGLEDRIVSEIRRISERVRLPEGLDE